MGAIIATPNAKPWRERYADGISGKSRARKWLQFLDLVKPLPQEQILDIGVNTTEYTDVDNYLEKNYPFPQMISAVGVGTDFSEFSKRYPEVKTFTSDGRRLEFEDDAFDIAYSNAVIEHVGPHADQVRFLKEMLRVSRRAYLTTPNRRFPIETHTLVPLLHMLPHSLFHGFLNLIGKGCSPGEHLCLLSERQLRGQLDEAGIRDYRLVKNRWLGFVMTFTVIWNKP